MAEEQEQPFLASKSTMDLTASQQLAESPRKPLPMSEVRHLGPVELIEFANELRNTPGVDLGAAERLASKSAPVIPVEKPPRRPRRRRGKDKEDQGMSAEQLKAQQQADMEVARLNKVIDGLKAQMQKRKLLIQ